MLYQSHINVPGRIFAGRVFGDRIWSISIFTSAFALADDDVEGFGSVVDVEGFGSVVVESAMI